MSWDTQPHLLSQAQVRTRTQAHTLTHNVLISLHLPCCLCSVCLCHWRRWLQWVHSPVNDSIVCLTGTGPQRYPVKHTRLANQCSDSSKVTQSVCGFTQHCPEVDPRLRYDIIHAACVNKNGSFIFLWIHNGAVKTYSCCMQTHHEHIGVKCEMYRL